MATPQEIHVPTIDDSFLTRQSTAELFETLARRMSSLVRAEVELLKVDTAARARGIVGAAIAAGLMIVVALGMVGALVAAVVLGFATVMPTWAAALVAAGGLGVAAAIAGSVARTLAKRAAPPIPKTAIRQVKQDVEWLTNRTKSSNGSR